MKHNNNNCKPERVKKFIHSFIMKLEKYYRTKTAGLEGQPNKKKNKRMADIVAVNVKYVLFG